MSVSYSIKSYKNFGKCVFITNGKITLGVTVELGPRVIYCALEGRENIMFVDEIRRFNVDCGSYGTWYNYGGHRLWCSPEVVPETYSPDNDPVDFRVEGNVFTFTAPATPFGKELSLIFEVSEDCPEVKVISRIRNVSDKPSEFAPWSLTCLADGSVAIMPMCTRKSGYLPNRVVSFWEYSDVADPRFKMTNTYARIRQDSFLETPFKAAFNNEDGWEAVVLKNQIFIKKISEYEFIRYPDYSCNVEVFTNDSFLECEVLGEYRAYAPGESAEIAETWKLVDAPDGYAPDIEQLRELAK
ncbi:MAG: hypothetical protein IKN17_08530 [Ruminococcus sp.]|nr:hypothetical protein [Ruminococcus sp.]